MIPLANAFDPDQTRGEAGNFSAELSDAASSAHSASGEAHAKADSVLHTRAAKLHRVAAKRATEDGKPGNAAMHEGIACGHDAMAACCDDEPVLANDAPGPLDNEGWALIAPFGDHPKTRLYRENGQLKTQKFIQVLDNQSADALLDGENSFFRKLKRAFVGIPIFKGHGDLNDHDPKALGNETKKIKLGVVDQIRKTARGIEAHFSLDNDGADAVAAGWKLPSAFWLVQPIGNDGDAIRARPFKLLSVALTQFPNISGVESLANQHLPAPITAPPINQPNTMLQEQIIGLLIGKGVTLANDAGEKEIMAALQNGDYVGHEFHGNQYAGGEAHGKEHEASRQAHLKSADANDKASHHAAAQAHMKAAAAHDKAGDTDAAEFHKAAANYHMGRAARFKN